LTAQEKVDIALLKEAVKDIKVQLDENTRVTKTIVSKLDNLSGGKQALMWITGTFIAIAAVIAAFFEGFRK